jgi:phosphoglycolate phosphatase
MKEYITYIFDLDGTLLDTLADLAASTNYALQAHGMPQHSIDDVRRFVGNGVRKLMERAVPEGTGGEQFEQVLATFREHYLHHNLDRTKPYPGILPLLQRLKAAGKQTAVVSNKFDRATKDLCNYFFSDLIGVAIGESERIRKKPAPDTVDEAIRLLHADRNTTVYIGDSEVDIATASNCHIPCITVLWGFRDRDFLLSQGATCLVESPEEIL